MPGMQPKKVIRRIEHTMFGNEEFGYMSDLASDIYDDMSNTGFGFFPTDDYAEDDDQDY